MKKFFHVGVVLALVAQRCDSCPIPINIRGQAGWGSEQYDLVENAPAHCRRLGLDDLSRSLPAVAISDSLIL